MSHCEICGEHWDEYDENDPHYEGTCPDAVVCDNCRKDCNSDDLREVVEYEGLFCPDCISNLNWRMKYFDE